MKASEFTNEVIVPKYQGWTTLLDWRTSARVHQVVRPDQDVPQDDAEHTLMFKLDEWPGGTPKAVIKEVVKAKYRKNAKLLLHAVRRDVTVAMKPDAPMPDDLDLTRGLFEVFLRLEAADDTPEDRPVAKSLSPEKGATQWSWETLAVEEAGHPTG
jgi:hypothetical protein